MPEPPSSNVSSEIAQRIVGAADQLYEENGRTSFPNVDSVRRKARVNMNDASAVMRIWRRTHTTVQAPPPVSIPDTVQSACQTMLGAVWAAATENANTSLHMAQAGWEQERAEVEACRQQLASAFDAQTEELSVAQRHGEALAERLALKEAEVKATVAKNEDLNRRAVEAEGKVKTALARVSEIASRVDDLKTALSRAHARVDEEQQEAKSRAEALEATMSKLREEVRQKWEVESELREELARLRGWAQAMATEHPLPSVDQDGKVSKQSKRPGAGNTPPPNGALSKGECNE